MATEEYIEGYSRHIHKGLAELTENSTEKDVQSVYDDWAPTYEKSLKEAHFMGTKPIVDIFDALPGMQSNKTIKILDAASGTGLVGEELSRRGYTNIHALDISQKMLDEAQKKNIYKKLICSPLTGDKTPDIEESEYDALLMAGALCVAHVKPEALEEVLRIIKPGGVACFSIRVDAYTPYEPKIKELETQHKWQLIKKTTIPCYENPELPRQCYLFIFEIITP